MELVRGQLLSAQVSSDFSQHLSNVLEWAFVFHLEGNGVEDLLSKIAIFNFLQLVEDGESSCGGLLQEYSA